MSGDDNFGQKYSNIQSSLQYFNFEGMDKDHIIQKYEEVLCQREKQIRDLSYEIGLINEKLCNESDKVKVLEEDNLILKNKLLKKESILEQEQLNKDIMFNKINILQDENDRLRRLLQVHDSSSGDDSLSSKKKKEYEYSSSSSASLSYVPEKDKEVKENKEIASSISSERKDSPEVEMPIQETSVCQNNHESTVTQTQTVQIQEEEPKIENEAAQPLKSTQTETETETETAHSDIYIPDNTLTTNITSSHSVAQGTKRYSKKQNTNIRTSLQSAVEKRLASESIDYDPVFNMK